MMVLAGLEQLHIRALFSKISSAVSLRKVALEVAGQGGRGPPASNVELCMCPANYLGDSCQVRQWGRAPVCPPSHVCPPTSLHSCPPSPPLFMPLTAGSPSQQPYLPASGPASRLLICLLIHGHPVSLSGPLSIHCPVHPSPTGSPRCRPPDHSPHSITRRVSVRPLSLTYELVCLLS